MAMGTVQAVNVLSLTPEGAKYNATGDTTEIWSAAVTTALAAGDTISGPAIPAGTYLVDVQVGFTDIDSANTATFECGYAGALAAFIASGNTTPQTGGVAHANVSTAMGFTAATNTTVLVTMTATAGGPSAGTVTILITYTASP